MKRHLGGAPGGEPWLRLAVPRAQTASSTRPLFAHRDGVICFGQDNVGHLWLQLRFGFDRVHRPEIRCRRQQQDCHPLVVDRDGGHLPKVQDVT